MKKVLFISYSQAGQTQRAIETFATGLGQHLEYDHLKIETEEEFPFPWKMTTFFRAFPRCIRGPLPQVKMRKVDWSQYELVVLAYQVWFLSPSLPIQGFLDSSDAQNLHGKKVLTLVTCRNLWLSALERMKQSLKLVGAEFLGQITLCETSPIWASFVTTPRWMLTGKKDGFAFFPPAGIGEDVFLSLESKGKKIGQAWALTQDLSDHRTVFGSNLNRVALAWMDRIGHFFFKFWAMAIQKIAPHYGLWQDITLVIFRLNLIALILILAPCTKIFELLVKNNSRWMPMPRGRHT